MNTPQHKNSNAGLKPHLTAQSELPKQSNAIFITGTSTGVGKTFISAMLMKAAEHLEIPLHYFKPIQTGEELDCPVVQKLSGVCESRIIQPIFYFKLPQAPYRASKAENKKVFLNQVVHHWQQQQVPGVIEGAGGLLVPLTSQHLTTDLIQALNIPLLIVASTQLGTINHTLLTVQSARYANIPVKGIILSGAPDPGLAETLSEFTSVPVLAEIPVIVSDTQFQEISQQSFDSHFFHRIGLRG